MFEAAVGHTLRMSQIKLTPEKDPEEWVTGAREPGVEVEDGLTKADASLKIEDLQEKTGRGS